MKEQEKTSIVFIKLLYNVFIIGGTAYLVFWKGQSGWWFILAMIFCSEDFNLINIEKNK